MHHLLYSSPPSLVCASETWLSSVPNSFLDPCGSFTVLRCDRPGDVRGGGTCAFIPRSWRCSQVDIDKTRIASSGCELVCFDINLVQYKLRFFVIYRPPGSKFSSESNRSNMTKLTEILFDYVDPRITHFILGDFNLPSIDWSFGPLHSDNFSAQKMFYDCVSSLGFIQFVTEGSRLNYQGSSNILDIILCNDPLGLSINNYLDPFSTSDHAMIDFSISIPYDESHEPVRSSTIKLPIYDWANANFQAINE